MKRQAQVGDRIVMAGGRIGKDGIHGATFSSEELHEGSPVTAVQIGDPITQKRMFDFLIIARDRGLYNSITDNGAGGLSSSVGEMAQDTGGFEMHLDRAPLKYPGLQPWEILISEAQERMTLAVPPASLDAFMTLSREMDVEATDLGQFTDSGYYHCLYDGKTVTCLPMDFLHDGVPQLQIPARWEPPASSEPALPEPADLHADLQQLLGRLNICSKEAWCAATITKCRRGRSSSRSPGWSTTARPMPRSSVRCSTASKGWSWRTASARATAISTPTT